MRKLSQYLALLTLTLGACTSQPAVQGTVLPEASTATPEPLIEQSVTTITELPAPDNQTETSSLGSVVYKIIPGESQLRYEVGEVFLNQNNSFNVAVGITSQVSGDIIIDLENTQNSSLGPISADISQFKSDSNRRDSALRDRFIQSARYPTVTFIASEISGLPVSYQEGQELQLQIRGDLTIRETTRAVEFQTTVTMDGGTLKGTATITILMSDFGFGPISIAGILNTEDEALVTLNFVAKP